MEEGLILSVLLASGSVDLWLSLLQTYRLLALYSRPVGLEKTSVGVHHGIDLGHSPSQATGIA